MREKQLSGIILARGIKGGKTGGAEGGEEGPRGTFGHIKVQHYWSRKGGRSFLSVEDTPSKRDSIISRKRKSAEAKH